MPEICTFDYAVVRIVPRVEREEFLNTGVILYCSTQAFLQARVELDHRRAAAFAPWLDLQVIEEHLATIPLICAGGSHTGPIGQLEQRSRFHWLVAPRSTIIQTSAVHSGLCYSPATALDNLFDKMVCLPGS